MAQTEQMHHPEGAGGPAPLTHVVNLTGALASLALIAGIGVWGYQMVMRDVSGVPVVRAAAGPMRIAPKDPGGQEKMYQGLSVNAVIMRGAADAPPERLILAPEPLDLTPLPARDDGARMTGSGDDGDSATLRLARVDAPAEGAAKVAPTAQEPPARSETAEPVATDAPPPVAGGLGRSLRPRLRPGGLATSPEAVALAAIAGATVRDIDPDTIAPGTRLAQLGAFASPEIAIREWNRLAERFDEFLVGKARVIQKAESGGRTFYRLRAMGFDDLNDARRFCSTLVAERAECIPVVVR